MNSDITVIVPYHNESHVIEDTLVRIANQSTPAKRAIFVNSSSTDNSSDIVDEWIKNNQNKFDTKFDNVFENTNTPGSSKNVGIHHANTEWLAFMDCGQVFALDWLEKQYDYAISNDLDIVFGVVYLTGINWLDRCAVSQTYGYKRERSCVPSSLVKKMVFDQTGLFLENRRSGYDMAWQSQVKRKLEKWQISKAPIIVYRGANFCESMSELFKKSILYSRHALGLEGYYIPYYYLLVFLVCVTVMVKFSYAAIYLFAFYFIVRSILVPIIKSKSTQFYREHFFEAAFGLGITGFVMDIGRLVGYFYGIADLVKKH